MEILIQLFFVLVLAAAALAGLTLWSRRHPLPKLLALGLAAVLMSVGYLAAAELLGRPKPVHLEWAQETAEEATVVAATWTEGEAIYLWLRLEGERAPRAYTLPWDRKTAEQLQGALRAGEREGAEVRARRLFAEDEERAEQMFYPAPPPPLPPKV